MQSNYKHFRTGGLAVLIGLVLMVLFVSVSVSWAGSDTDPSQTRASAGETVSATDTSQQGSADLELEKKILEIKHKRIEVPDRIRGMMKKALDDVERNNRYPAYLKESMVFVYSYSVMANPQVGVDAIYKTVKKAQGRQQANREEEAKNGD